MVEVKLANHKSAQATVCIYHTGNIEFWSYNTMVIRAEKQPSGMYIVSCTGTYSQTTRRQINWFLSEYFNSLNYYDMKESAKCGNVFEAEISRNINHLIRVA